MAGSIGGRWEKRVLAALVMVLGTGSTAGVLAALPAVPAQAAGVPSPALYIAQTGNEGSYRIDTYDSGSIGAYDPADVASGPSVVYPPKDTGPVPDGAAGYDSAALVGNFLVGMVNWDQTLFVFNTLTDDTAGRAVPLPSTVGTVTGMVASPDGAWLYLVATTSGGDLEVTTVNTFTWTMVATVDFHVTASTDTATPTLDPSTGDLWIPQADGVVVVDPDTWSSTTLLAGQATGQVAFDAGAAWVPTGQSVVEVANTDLTTVRTVALVGQAMAAMALPGSSAVLVADVVPPPGTPPSSPSDGVHVSEVDTATGTVTDLGVAVPGPLSPDISFAGAIMTGSGDGRTVYLVVTTSFFGTKISVPDLVTVNTATGALSSAVKLPGNDDGFGGPVTALLASPPSPPPSQGYWEVGQDGGVFAFGDAGFLGSMGGKPLNQPIVGMASTPDGGGYWQVAADGGVFAFGDAGFYGSMGGAPLNRPIVGMAATPDGRGYWEVGQDGGVFAFGDAGFYGSMGGKPLNASIVGMAPTPDGGGYWLVAADGGVFAFGDARFRGSAGGTSLDAPVVGMAADPGTGGYWLVAADGGVFAFGAPFLGSATGTAVPVEGMATAPGDQGYWLVDAAGGLDGFGTAGDQGSPSGLRLAAGVIGMAAVPGSA